MFQTFPNHQPDKHREVDEDPQDRSGRGPTARAFAMELAALRKMD